MDKNREKRGHNETYVKCEGPLEGTLRKQNNIFIFYDMVPNHQRKSIKLRNSL